MEEDLRCCFNLVSENGVQYLNTSFPAFLQNALSSRYKSSLEIYVRDSYKSLYELIKQRILKEEFEFATGLITGVPGIGKSYFLLYVIYRFINDESFHSKPFSVHVEWDNCILFTPNSSGKYVVQVKRRNNIINKILLLSDLDEPRFPRFKGKWTLIFSSPNDARYKEPLKVDPSFEMIMPTWSEEELLCIDPDRKSWCDKFLLYGGVPRRVFNTNQEQQVVSLETLLETKGARIANRYFSTGFGDIDSDISYSITHINPPRLDDDSDWNYFGKRQFSFASEEIFIKIYDDFDKKILNDAINILNSGIGPKEYGAATCGLILEKFCLFLSPIYGKTLELRPLEKTDDDMMLTENLNSTFSLRFPKKMERLNSTFVREKNLKPNIFYHPRSANLQSGDAFCAISVNGSNITEYMLIVLQITVAESHPIKVKGLQDILSAYPDEIRKKITKKELVFVTTNYRKLKSLQRYVSVNGKAYQGPLPTDIKEFRQSVAEYNIPSMRKIKKKIAK